MRHQRTSKITVLAVVLVTMLTASAAAQQQCSDTQFVQRAFADLLYRSPEDAALSFYTPLVASAGRQAVAASIVGSQEYADDLVGGNPTVVTGFYQKYLGRNPYADDVTFWDGKQPIKDSQIIATLMGSSEYQTRASSLNPSLSTTKQRLVNQIFLDLLGRNAMSSEMSTFGAQSATTIATTIMSGDEYNTRVIRQSVQRMLHRAPSSSDITFFLSALKTSSRPDEDLLSALAGSAEYCNGAPQTATFAIVSPSDTYAPLNNPTIASNVNQLPAVQFGPLDAAANADIMMLGAQAASAASTIAALQAQVASLQDQISTDANTINTLQSQVSSLQSQVNTLQQQAATDASTIASLNGKVSTLQQQAATDANTIASLNAQLSTLQGQVNTLNGQVSSLQQQLAAAQAQIAPLQTQVVALQLQVTTDATTQATLNSTIASLTSQLNDANAKIKADEEKIFEIASTLLGKFPTKEVAVAIGNVAQQYVDNATGRAPMLREARAAMLRGNADVARGAYEDAIRDFRLAYLLVTNGAKHE